MTKFPTMKALLSLAFTLVLSVSLFGTHAAAAGLGFSDVKASDYFHDPVQWAVKNGITSGTSANTFSPNATCTRGQVATFLYAAAKGSPTHATNRFSDIRPADYYYKPVLWAVENGITSGTSASTFSPNDGCTRGQVVTFLWRAAGSPQPNSTYNKFKDVTSSDYYFKAVLWAAEQGITGGTSQTTFSPNQQCTRGQIVTFLHHYYGDVNTEPPVVTPSLWDSRFDLPTQSEISAYNSTHPAYRSPYIAGWLQIGKNVRFKEYSVDFKADHVPQGTYCSLANWYMDLSDLQKTHTNVHTNSGSIQAYAGLQNTVTDMGMTSIMSFWDVFATDRYGKEITIRAKLIYPASNGNDDFDNEGTGAHCIRPFAWEADHWYRMLLQCGTSAETGNTTVEQWICDLETNQWTKLCVYDTGLKNSCFVGNVAFFLENYIKELAGDVRSMEIRNPRIRKVGDSGWTNLTQAYMTSQGGIPKYNGSYAFGTDNDRFWMITSGVGGDWYGNGKGQAAKTYTISNNATGSPYQ